MNAPARGARSFAGASYAQALADAQSLVPALRERAGRAEDLRVLLPETLADLHRTGLMRALQPRRWGGMEFDFVAYVDISAELARGCASTGWTAGNLLIHHWMLALFDERAQQEAWGANPEALIASGIAYPQGSGRAAPAGGAATSTASAQNERPEWRGVIAARSQQKGGNYEACDRMQSRGG